VHLRSFWHHFHVHLTSQSTAVVCYYPQDMGAMTSLNLASNRLYAEGAKFFAEAIKVTKCTLAIISAPFSCPSDHLTSQLTVLVCYYLQDMEALSSANLLWNNIGSDQAHALATILKEHPTLKSLCGNKGGETELEMSRKELGAAGAIMLAPEIAGNGALLVTNVLGNKIGKEQLTKLQEIMCSKPKLVSLCGIADDATEANLSGFGIDADDATILASELPDKGALTSLILSKNQMTGAEAGKALGDALAVNTVLKELDLSGAEYDANMDIAFLGALASGLSANGVLTSVDASRNMCGVLATEDGWTSKDGDNRAPWVHPDGRRQQERPEGLTPIGVIAIANAIPDMRALTKLDARRNNIYDEGKSVLQQAAGSRYVPA
jgi:hypothetical protein